MSSFCAAHGSSVTTLPVSVSKYEKEIVWRFRVAYRHGKVVTELPCAAQNDDMWMDVPRKRIYVTGTKQPRSSSRRTLITTLTSRTFRTGFRARTSILVPELNRLYVAVSGKGKPDAKLALQIYENTT